MAQKGAWAFEVHSVADAGAGNEVDHVKEEEIPLPDWFAQGVHLLHQVVQDGFEKQEGMLKDIRTAVEAAAAAGGGLGREARPLPAVRLPHAHAAMLSYHPATGPPSVGPPSVVPSEAAAMPRSWSEHTSETHVSNASALKHAPRLEPVVEPSPRRSEPSTRSLAASRSGESLLLPQMPSNAALPSGLRQSTNPRLAAAGGGMRGSTQQDGLRFAVDTHDVADMLAGARAAMNDLHISERQSQQLQSKKGDDLTGQVSRSENSESFHNAQSLRWKRASARADQSRLATVISTLAHQWRSLLRSFLFHGGAPNALCTIVILLDAVLLGVQVDHAVKYGEDTRTSRLMDGIQHAIIGWYIVEILMRIAVARSCFKFCFGKEWRWNLFDTIILSLSLMDMILSSLNLRELALARTMRVVRLIRMFRLLRCVAFLRESQKLVLCLVKSFQTLLCVFALMTFCIYGMSVILTRAVASSLQDITHGEVGGLEPEQVSDLQQSFGSISDSMLSIYMAITAGRSWGELYQLLRLADSGWVPVAFLAFLGGAIFGLLNVVTAVFVESAMQATQTYRDLMVQEMMVKDTVIVKHMKDIFRSIDADNSGSISFEEMNSFLMDETLALQEYFEALDIAASDTETLFKLLDRNGSGQVSIDEFCDGCMRLGGPAKSFDMNCMWHEQRRANQELLHFIQHASIATHTMRKAQEEVAVELFALSQQTRGLIASRSEPRSCAPDVFSGEVPEAFCSSGNSEDHLPKTTAVKSGCITHKL